MIRIFLSIMIAAFLVCDAGAGTLQTKQAQVLAKKNAVVAITDYCTGATTCTATKPGSCEVICEDFEGAADCGDDAGGDTNCQGAWTFILGTGSTADTTTSHAGTFGCNDKGTNAVTLTANDVSQTTYFSAYLGSDRAIMYMDFYINPTLTLANTKAETILLIGDSAVAQSVRVDILNTSGTYNLRLYGHGCATTSTGTTSINVDGSTWYRIGIEADTTNDHLTLYVNGSQEINKTDYTTTRIPRIVINGWLSAGYREATAASVQYDNIAISATAQPGGCN